MSKKRGLSVDEKRIKIKEILLETVTKILPITNVNRKMFTL